MKFQEIPVPEIVDTANSLTKPALHSFVDEHNYIDDLPKSGAGGIIMLYDNHA
jgi:hypothetical protein